MECGRKDGRGGEEGNKKQGSCCSDKSGHYDLEMVRLFKNNIYMLDL